VTSEANSTDTLRHPRSDAYWAEQVPELRSVIVTE